MQTFEVGRTLSFDYLLLVPLTAAVFNLLLVFPRKYKELAVFNLAGLINLAAELLMVRSGAREFSLRDPVPRIMVLICLSWVTNGFLFALAYINVRQWLKRVYDWRFVIAVNVIFFLILPLAMMNYGILDGSIQTWRHVKNTFIYGEAAIFFITAAAIWLLGYRRLLWRLLAMGWIIDLEFEGTLFLFGIRPLSQLNWGQVIPRVLFEMNVALLIGFLALKLVFKLGGYRDKALGVEES